MQYNQTHIEWFDQQDKTTRDLRVLRLVALQCFKKELSLIDAYRLYKEANKHIESAICLLANHHQEESYELPAYVDIIGAYTCHGDHRKVYCEDGCQACWYCPNCRMHGCDNN